MKTRYGHWHWPVLRSAGGTDIASHVGTVAHGSLKVHVREYTPAEAAQVCDWLNGTDKPLDTPPDYYAPDFIQGRQLPRRGADGHYPRVK